MGIFKKKKNVKDEIILVLEKMNGVDPDSDEYTRMAKNLETLCSANEKSSKNRMSLIGPIVAGVFSLAGIILIVCNEETRVISSKALGLVIKGRI